MKSNLLALCMLALVTAAATPAAHGFDGTPYGQEARWRAAMRPWHGQFYDVAWGQPVALVVPPTAEMQTDYRWGVCGTEVTRIDHQFQRPFPGVIYGSGGPYEAFLPTPHWPSHTRQFGVYYVRGPW